MYGLDWLDGRLMDRGRAVPRMQRWTNPVRGRVTIAEERDPDRGRVVRVARLQAPGQEAQALYDVQLVGGTGEAWTLAGYERVLAGPLAEAVMVAQAWALKPAPDADLERAEAELQRLRRLVAQLQRGRSGAVGTR